MEWLLVAALAMLPGMKSNKLCPRPILVKINLNHPIDRGVFKRTFMKCRRHYQKSPCLVKLMQPEKGAFQAICGETQTGLKNGIQLVPLPLERVNEEAFLLNCSSDIFASNQPGDWSSFQSSPITPNTLVEFCPSIEMRTEDEGRGASLQVP